MSLTYAHQISGKSVVSFYAFLGFARFISNFWSWFRRYWQKNLKYW